MTIKVSDMLHYGAGIGLIVAGSLSEVLNTLPGVHIDAATAIAGGLGLLGIGYKADQALKSVVLPFAGAAVGLAMLFVGASPASAADQNLLLKTPLTSAPSCTLTACSGWFVGGNFANAGGNIDVVGSGLQGLASNGLGIGAQFGGEFYNGQFYAAARFIGDYDFELNAPHADISDRLMWGGIGSLGYSLAIPFGAAATGTTAPTLPQQLLSSLMTPYINAGIVRRHGQTALASGAGIEALLATNWTLNVDYLHFNYQSGTVGSAPVTTQTTDNLFVLSINRHFGF